MILIKHNCISFFAFINYVAKRISSVERKSRSSPRDGNKGNYIEIKRFSSFYDFPETEKIPAC